MMQVTTTTTTTKTMKSITTIIVTMTTMAIVAIAMFLIVVMKNPIYGRRPSFRRCEKRLDFDRDVTT